ncbi:hypothetical protein E2C01_069050 [Portunus trituberculatus]|uniref:Uncharacterized protein n=1 Tax=Portunus trituberculatus TaxID=210409 RepID=A0A5B7I152_PORTR|nr:hypothetical protein [Portunus trituberculatus]
MLNKYRPPPCLFEVCLGARSYGEVVTAGEAALFGWRDPGVREAAPRGTGTNTARPHHRGSVLFTVFDACGDAHPSRAEHVGRSIEGAAAHQCHLLHTTSFSSMGLSCTCYVVLGLGQCPGWLSASRLSPLQTYEMLHLAYIPGEEPTWLRHEHDKIMY